MMTNKEKLEQLSEYIKKLTVLTEEISERDIYPVSFFSQAYDITNSIQEELRQIEITQIDLFEKQMKEHQAQILSIIPQQEKPEIPDETKNTTADSPPLPTKELCTPPATELHPQPITASQPFPETNKKIHSLQDEKPVDSPIFTNYPTGEINRIDLKKIITLNDRFLFCRELFSNDENLMNRTIADLNKTKSFEASMDYIKKNFDWNVEDDHVAYFIVCLKKSFIN